ncbi:MAG TPA: hypothetical protein VGD41_18020 [Pyrinomonadaceae bacterium]
MVHLLFATLPLFLVFSPNTIVYCLDIEEFIHYRDVAQIDPAFIDIAIAA